MSSLSIRELKLKAGKIGIARPSNDRDELVEQIKEKLKNMRKHPARLDFDQGVLLLSDRNKEILAKPQTQVLTKAEVLEKLAQYQVLDDNNNTTPKNWVRFINIEEGVLKGGGFPIKNNPDEPFIVLKNASLNFTFSLQKADIILFERLSKSDITSLGIERLIEKYMNKTGDLYMALTPDRDLLRANTVTELARKLGGSASGLRKALKKGANIYKDNILFNLSIDDGWEFFDELQEAGDGNTRRLSKILSVVNRFY